MASSITGQKSIKKVNTLPETLRIIENAYKQDFVKVAEDANKLADKFEKAGDVARAERVRNKIKRFDQSKQAGNLTSLSKQYGAVFDLHLPVESQQKCSHFIPNKQNEVAINEIVATFEKKEEFREAEVPLPNKTLMFGPPGTGKTTSAHYIASRLELPLILVRLDSIISSSLGGTASNIRKVFDTANKQPCVLFLDEFDAIAADRNRFDGSGADSEMRRVVNSLLQNMDSLSEETMLLAATNLDDNIDTAIWRRFHNRMHCVLPNEEEVLQYLLGQLDDNLIIYDVLPKMVGYSFADIEMILNKAKTKAILRSIPLSNALINETLKEHLLKKR